MDLFFGSQSELHERMTVVTNHYFIGIDVGTGSARAGIFDEAGRLLASVAHDIDQFRYPGDIAEQSSENIWECVCKRGSNAGECRIGR